jgi:sugar lactone lactonase YvrE
MKKAIRCGLCLLAVELLISSSAAPSWADLWGFINQGNGTPGPGTEDNYNKVFRFDRNGNKLPNDIPRSPGISQPSGIAVGGDGNIYVSWAGIGSILYYDGQSGAPLGTFASLGDAAPAQLKFGPDGNLYVSEFFGQNVRVYDAHSGVNFGQRLADAAHGLTSAGGLAFLPNGDLLIGDGFYGLINFTPSRIAKVSPGNPVASTWGTTGSGSFYAPESILTQADGTVLVVDTIANYILRVDGSGNPIAPFAVINPYPPADGVSNYPSDIKFDPDGNLMVSVLGETNPPAATHGALWRYTLNGSIIDPDGNPTTNPIVNGLEPIGGIAYTPVLTTLGHDYNGDTTIGALDYIKWRQNFGKFVANGNNADGNSDGVVEVGDYVAWRKAAAASASALGEAAVPEPTGLALLISGLFASWTAHRGQRRR